MPVCLRFARVAERVRRRHAAARRVRTSRVVVVLVRRASSGAERLRLSGRRVRSARCGLRPVTVIGLKTHLRRCDQSGAYVVAGTASPDVLRNPGRQGYWYPLYLDKDAATKEFGARIIEITFIQIPQVVFYGPAEDPEARRRLMCAPEFGWCPYTLTPRVRGYPQLCITGRKK